LLKHTIGIKLTSVTCIHGSQNKKKTLRPHEISRGLSQKVVSAIFTFVGKRDFTVL